jgi:hypothetical protein
MNGLHRSTLFERQESPVDIRQVGITYYSNIPYINVSYHIWRYLQHTLTLQRINANQEETKTSQ